MVSELGVEAPVHGDAARLIAGHAHRPSLADLVIAFHNLSAGLRNVGRKRKEQIPGDSLLDGNARRWIRVVATEQGIDPHGGDQADATSDGGPAPPGDGEPDLKDAGAGPRQVDLDSTGSE